jgi:hypothetical protein
MRRHLKLRRVGFITEVEAANDQALAPSLPRSKLCRLHKFVCMREGLIGASPDYQTFLFAPYTKPPHPEVRASASLEGRTFGDERHKKDFVLKPT